MNNFTKSIIGLLISFVIIFTHFEINIFASDSKANQLPTVAVLDGQANKVISSNKLVYIDGYPHYGLCTINGKYYLPLALIDGFDFSIGTIRSYTIYSSIKNELLTNYAFAQIPKETKRFAISYNLHLDSEGNQPDFIMDYAYANPDGRVVGDATKARIIVTIGSWDDTRVIDTYDVGGDFPLISFDTLAELFANQHYTKRINPSDDNKGVTFNKATNAFYIGKSKTKKDISMEKDLVGKYIWEIVNDKMSDKEKVKAIHDFILKKMTYDYYPFYERVFMWSDTPLTQTQLDKMHKLQAESEARMNIAYEKGINNRANKAVYFGTGVCQDYSELFQSFCDRLAIPNILIHGEEMWHAWNKVYVDGQWLYVDCTWDDTQNEKYKYFLKDEAFMRKDHYILDKEYAQFEDFAWHSK